MRGLPISAPHTLITPVTVLRSMYSPVVVGWAAGAAELGGPPSPHSLTPRTPATGKESLYPLAPLHASANHLPNTDI